MAGKRRRGEGEGAMKFLVDHMLGKLAKELRMLGYDTIYYRGEDPRQLIQLARQESRLILTRNTKLIPKRPEDRIVKVMEDQPLLQLRELAQKEYISLDGETLFSRCLVCNTLLDEIPREEVQGRVPDFIFYQQREFSQCPQCQRIYWQGSHHENMKRKINHVWTNTK